MWQTRKIINNQFSMSNFINAFIVSIQIASWLFDNKHLSELQHLHFEKNLSAVFAKKNLSTGFLIIL